MNVNVTDNLPGYLALLNATPTVGTWTAPIWSIGTLANGETVTLTLTARVDSDVLGTISNTATVSSDTPDPEPGNNSDTEYTTVNTSADLAISKSDDPDPVIAGETITYTIVVKNNGPSDALNVNVTDNLPGYLALLNATPTVGTWTAPIWSIGTLANGETVTLTLTARVDSDVLGTISNTATVSSDTPDPEPGNNSDTEYTTVNTSADLAISKTGLPDPIVIVDQVIIYTITVENLGPSDALDVQVVDVLPVELFNAELSIDNGQSWSNWNNSYSFGTLQVGADFKIFIRATVDLNVPHEFILENTGTVSSTTYDPVPANNSDDHSTTVWSLSDLAIVKTVNDEEPNVADIVTFTLVLTNYGPAPNFDIEVSDMVPDGFMYMGHTEHSGDFNPLTGIWALGYLEAGGTATLTIDAMVNEPFTGIEYTNTASVTDADINDPEPDNDTDNAVVSPKMADLAIVKTVNNTAPLIGANVVFTLTVTNYGHSDATQVIASDVIPSGYTYLSDNGAGSYNSVTGIWTIGNLAKDQSRSLQITARVREVGNYVNGAVVMGYEYDPEPFNNFDDVATTPIAQPRIGVVKLSSYNPSTGLITYTYVVTNTGNVTVYDVVVAESTPSFSGTGILPVPVYFTGGSHIGGNPSLRDIIPGQRIIFTATYAVTQADIDAGRVVNQALGSGSTLQGNPVTDLSDHTNNSNDRPTITPLIQNPDIELTKTASPVTYSTIGQLITYSIKVKNTGNVSLSDLIITDPLLALNTIIPMLTPNQEIILTPVYSITQDNLIAGTVVNIASVNATGPGGAALTDSDNAIITAHYNDITANDDDLGTVFGNLGLANAGNVLLNDELNNAPAAPANVTIHVVTPASPVNPGDPVPVLDPLTGIVSVTAGTPFGLYTITYRICETLNPFNCDEAVVTINVVDYCVEIETFVLLEGASIHPGGVSSFSLPMRTSLNDLRILPGQTFDDLFLGTYYTPAGQPYNESPWFYNGSEGDNFDSNGNLLQGDAGYSPMVVDWVLVSLRDNPMGNGGPVCQAAAQLHNDGTVEFVGGSACCNLSETQSYYIVIEHRNHLIVMSHEPVGISDDKISYDFRYQQGYVDDPFGFGIFSSQKEILPGVFAMIGGNGQQSVNISSDTDINFDDRAFWENQNGTFARYRNGDFNLNGDVNFNDRTIWEGNNGKFTSVPRN